jgi:hypothetical protein
MLHPQALPPRRTPAHLCQLGLPVGVIPEFVPFPSLPALLIHIAPSGQGPQLAGEPPLDANPVGIGGHLQVHGPGAGNQSLDFISHVFQVLYKIISSITSYKTGNYPGLVSNI